MQTHDSEFHRTTKPGSLYPFLRTTQAQLRPIHPQKLKSNLTASVLTSKVSIVTKRSDWIPSRWNTAPITDLSTTQPHNSSSVVGEVVPGSPKNSQATHKSSQHSHPAMSSTQSIVISVGQHHNSLTQPSHDLSGAQQDRNRPMLPATSTQGLHQTTANNNSSATPSKHSFLKNPRDRLQLAPYLHQSLDRPRVRRIDTVARRPVKRPHGVPVDENGGRTVGGGERKAGVGADLVKGLAQGGGRRVDRSLLRSKDPQVPTFPTLKNQNTEQGQKPKIQLKDKSRVTVIPKPEGLSSHPEPTKYQPSSQHQAAILVEQPHPWEAYPPTSLMKNRITSRPRRGSRSEDPPAKPSPDPTSRNSIPDSQQQPNPSPNRPHPPKQHEHQPSADRTPHNHRHKHQRPYPADDDGDDDSETHRRAQNKQKTDGEGVSDGDWSRRSAESTGRSSLPQLGFLVVGCAN